ncbi:MAG: hypothetical protein PG979_000828 [Rickettsia asembonensis]|nr:hypothetical protein [Rickettsia asembonensis]WCR56771.1 MAG: hypothetical protein PG979_000828 [Rickettsia asembonensis]
MPQERRLFNNEIIEVNKLQALIDNFDAFTMSDLALVLTKTVGEIKTDNERLVGLNNTMLPFRGTGARPVRSLNEGSVER